MLIEKVSNEKQIEIIEALADKIWREHFTPIIGNDQVNYMLEKFQSKKSISEQIQQGYLYFLMKNNADYIGYMGALPQPNHLFLSKLYIISAERNKGYGRNAIQYLEQIARTKGLDKLSLTVNKNNIATIKTYKKFGFVNLGSIVQDIGNHFVMDDYKMEKNI